MPGPLGPPGRPTRPLPQRPVHASSVLSLVPRRSTPCNGRAAVSLAPPDPVCTVGHRAAPLRMLLCGAAEDALALLPDACVNTVLTSPPYWSLRDYGVDGQTGHVESVEEYTDRLVRLFRQVRRLLTPTGTLWIVIGDAYTSGNRRPRARAMRHRPPTPVGLKAKDLVGIPWRVGSALQTDGWWLRAEIIWSKPNAYPESVRDRPTRAHETVFLFARNERYLYNTTAGTGPDGRRLRTVWKIATDPLRNRTMPSSHPSPMPLELATPVRAPDQRPRPHRPRRRETRAALGRHRPQTRLHRAHQNTDSPAPSGSPAAPRSSPFRREQLAAPNPQTAPTQVSRSRHRLTSRLPPRVAPARADSYPVAEGTAPAVSTAAWRTASRTARSMSSRSPMRRRRCRSSAATGTRFCGARGSW